MQTPRRSSATIRNITGTRVAGTAAALSAMVLLSPVMAAAPAQAEWEWAIDFAQPMAAVASPAVAGIDLGSLMAIAQAWVAGPACGSIRPTPAAPRPASPAPCARANKPGRRW